MKKRIDEILKEFDKHNEMQEWCSGKDAEEIKQFISKAITKAYNKGYDDAKELAFEENKANIAKALDEVRVEKDEFVGLNSKTNYDNGYKDGFNQAVDDLNQNIKKVKEAK